MFFRFMPFVVFDPEDVPAVTPPEPAPAAAPEPAPQPGPWDADLAVFEDPELRAQVDGFMREKVQPRMTQLETQLAQRKPAHDLYDDLSGSDADEALKQVIAEIHDPELAEKFAALLEPEVPTEPEPEPVPVAETPAPVELPQEIQEIVAERQAAKEQEDYDNDLKRVQALHPDLKIEDEFFAPFVAAAEGDFDIAVDLFRTFEAKATERYGPAPEPVPEPPATLTESANPAPPVEKKYATMDDAFDAWFEEMRESPAAPVGVV